jgi:bacillithiol biosynthesis deacetylase BshB1
MTPVDLLAFGPHPDDIEIGFAGTIAAHAAQGFAVGLCDLTRGELGSNGTPDERVREAEDARAVLGAAWRVNLGWPDGGIAGTDAQVADIVRLIRAVRPRTLALPYWDDRHPDHRGSSWVLAGAAFKAGLRRFVAEGAGEPWKADWICYYFINDAIEPSFAIDVSAHYDLKRRALACYRSQFAPSDPDSVPTRLTAVGFRQMIESRDALLGARAGVAFAEGIHVRDPLLRPNLLKDWGA